MYKLQDVKKAFQAMHPDAKDSLTLKLQKMNADLDVKIKEYSLRSAEEGIPREMTVEEQKAWNQKQFNWNQEFTLTKDGVRRRSDL